MPKIDRGRNYGETWHMVSTCKCRLFMVLMVSVIALSALGSAPARAHADDEALKIDQLARRLYQENAIRGGFTVWVNGDIGDDLAARRTWVGGGEPLPAFKFTQFDSDATIQPQDVKRPYILNFWASWCSACRDEFPLFTRRLKDQSLPIPVIFVNGMDFYAYADTLDTIGNWRR